MEMVQVSAQALETMQRMVNKLDADNKMLLEAAQFGLSNCESFIYSELDGTSYFESAMKRLEPIRVAIQQATA